MITIIKTRRSDNKVLCESTAADNWFNVYQNRARFEGRRLHWLSEKAYKIIFTEKNYTLTLIKE